MPYAIRRLATAAALRELSELLTLANESPFRARAYARAAQVLEELSGDFDALVREGRLDELAGIGPSLARAIAELARTGRLGTLERLRREYPPAIRELARVVSLPRARALHAALGVGTLAELRAACADGRVAGVRGFGPRTAERICHRIDALGTEPERVLLPEAVGQVEALLAFLRPHPAVERAEPAGAVRRLLETPDRLEVVVATRDGAAAGEHLRRYPRALAVDAAGADGVVLRQAGGLTATIRLVAPDVFGSSWIEATGSPGHLAALHARTAAHGRVLGNATRAGRGGPGETAREEDVYGALDLPWIPPELREGAGEVEAAAAGTLPERLVQLEDLQGAVHCHTVYSDGRASVEEMARAAAALGLRYLTITDHSASADYAGGLSVERLRRQADEIARVQERVGVRLLRGVESDILADGALDYPDAVLRELEVIIASVHQRHRLDADAMTRRLVRAMRHPVFKIWGHALGRYVLSRPPFECHVEEVLDAIADSRAAIEVNGDPNRLDLEPHWIRAARRRGIPFVISADAHSTAALHNLRWGVAMARRGWLTPGEVLNTRSADAFAAAVRP